jgi:hypothetical protein
MKAFEIPFISFPLDWKIKFIYPLLESPCLLRFLVKKEGAPNIASVAILKIGDEYNWEVGVYEGDKSDGSIGSILNIGEADLELLETDLLLKFIEEYLFREIPDYEEEN